MTNFETGVGTTEDTGPTPHTPTYQNGVAAVFLSVETLTLFHAMSFLHISSSQSKNSAEWRMGTNLQSGYLWVHTKVKVIIPYKSSLQRGRAWDNGKWEGPFWWGSGEDNRERKAGLAEGLQHSLSPGLGSRGPEVKRISGMQCRKSDFVRSNRIDMGKYKIVLTKNNLDQRTCEHSLIPEGVFSLNLLYACYRTCWGHCRQEEWMKACHLYPHRAYRSAS